MSRVNAKASDCIRCSHLPGAWRVIRHRQNEWPGIRGHVWGPSAGPGHRETRRGRLCHCDLGGLHLSQTSCVHMDIQVTDSEGSYFFGPWIDFVGRVVFRQNSPHRMVYAPGYEKVNYGDPTYVRRHHDKPKERIKGLDRILSLFCGDSPASERTKEEELRRDMYHEAEAELKKVVHDPNGEYKFRVDLMKRDCGRPCE